MVTGNLIEMVVHIVMLIIEFQLFDLDLVGHVKLTVIDDEKHIDLIIHLKIIIEMIMDKSI